jgi:hypothetical protein
MALMGSSVDWTLLSKWASELEEMLKTTSRTEYGEIKEEQDTKDSQYFRANYVRCNGKK